MVVIDPETNFQFFPAIVTEVYNRFFYRLSLLEDCSKPFEQWKTINRCIYSSDIFPFGQGHRDKCSTALPKGISSYDKLTVEEISRLIDFDCDLTQAPTNRFPLYNLVSETQSSVLFEMDNDGFNDPGFKIKLSRQLIEVYLDGDYSAVHFGRILRTTKHFLFVSIETFGKFSSPKIFSLTDPNIFPLGYAEKYQIPIYLPHVFLEPLLQPLHIEKMFTADPLVDDGRNYMAPLWLERGRWCPKLYINRKCYAGPFVDSKRIWRLEDSYGPGPLPKVLECLVSDFVTCCEGSKLMHIFDAKKLDGIFTLPAKYYSNSDNDRQHSSTNVVNFTFVGCQHVRVLPQWLNILCRMVDACPGFISTKEIKNKCIYDCSTVSSRFPYLLPDTHVNTAYSLHVSKDRAKQKKRRTIVEQLQSNSPRRRRSRINASSFANGEESDEDSRSSSPIIETIISRRRTISTSVRPTIIRPIKPTEVSSDSSSDDDVIPLSDEEIPTLAREMSVNEFNQRNGGGSRYSNSPTFPYASTTPYDRPHPNTLSRPTMPLRPQFRTLGPKIRYPSQPAPAMFTGPIMDPRKVYVPHVITPSRPPQNSNPVIRPTPIRPTIPSTQISSSPSNRHLRIDPATGKYMIMSSFNQQKVSPPTVSSSTKVEPLKADTPPPPTGQAFPDVNSDPRTWRVAQVSAWICKSFEKDFSHTLFKHRVSGMQLLKLTTHDLSQMGIPFGRALKLQDLIRKLRVYTEKTFGNIDDAIDV
uniref:SAM domain-containing protein n=1 Tax=Panagrolaimus superbus TaxID=310955 RepID=A0A914Y6N6_9BILA